MCGTLKFENRAHKVGNIIPVINRATNKWGNARWTGFAQCERMEFWRTSGKAVDISIPADRMIEQNIEFRLKGTLKALGIKNTVNVHGRIVANAGEVKIVTRAPLSTFERKIHHRWPVVHLPDGNVQIFTFNDVMSGPGQLALL